MYEVKDEDLLRLGEETWLELLLILLVDRALKIGVSREAITVCMNTKAKDGGEDARFEWHGDPNPPKDGLIANHLTIYQSKAEDFGPARCAKEVDAGKKVKDVIDEVLKASGAYTLFIRQACTKSKAIKDRIEAVRDVLRKYKKPYAETAQIDVIDISRVRELVNGSLNAIAFVVPYVIPTTVVQVLREANKGKHKGTYFANQVRNDLIAEVKTRVAAGNEHLRLYGPIGSGRTRFILHIFEGLPIEARRAVYWNAKEGGDSIVSHLRGLSNQGVSGILIVDDCPVQLHRRIVEVLDYVDNKIRIVTIGTERVDNQSIPLGTVDGESMREMLLAKNSELAPSITNRILSASNGFPKMAMWLYDRYSRENKTDFLLEDDDYLNELIGTSLTEKQRTLLDLVSLFKEIRTEPDDELQQIANFAIPDMGDNLRIARNTLDDLGDLLETVGNYVRVRQLPLALRLAHDYLRKNDFGPFLKFTFSDGLKRALADQLGNLYFLQDARELVVHLVGEQGPFHNADALFTPQGSCVIRALADVNPEAILNLLERLLEGAAIEQLRVIAGYSGYIIESVRAITFYKDYFERGAKLLERIASLEDERWSLGAKRHFAELFQPVLPGTEASLDERAEFFERELLGIGKPTTIMIEALEHALSSGHFTRMGGFEPPSSLGLATDFRPNALQLHQYWRRMLGLLSKMLFRAPDGSSVFGILKKVARGLIHSGYWNDIHEILEESRKRFGNLPPEIVQTLENARAFEEERNPLLASNLKNYITELTFGDIRHQLLYLVTQPPWWNFADRSRGYEDLAAKRVRAFASEVLSEKIDIIAFLPDLSSGEQRQTYVFAEELQKLGADWKGLLESSIEALRSVPVKKRNPAFAAGLISKVEAPDDREFLEHKLDELATDQDTVWLVSPLTRAIHIQPRDLDRLVTLYRTQKIDSNQIHLLSYGRVLSHLSAEEISDFVIKLTKISLEGAVLAIQILGMYLLSNEEKVAALLDTIRSVLKTEGLMAAVDDNQDADYQWGNLAVVAAVTNPDQSLIAFLIGEIHADTSSYYSSHGIGLPHFMVALLESPLMPFAWNEIQRGLENGKNYPLETLIFGSTFYGPKDIVLADKIGEDNLLAWCVKRPNTAPLIVAGHIELTRIEGGNVIVDKFAQKFLSKFGEDSSIRDRISSQLFYFGWSGTPIPEFTARKHLLESLLTPQISGTYRKWIEEQLAIIEKEMSKEERELAEQAAGIHR